MSANIDKVLTDLKLFAPAAVITHIIYKITPTQSAYAFYVRQMKTAEGHAVRALYLYTAMANVARLKGDDELLAVCQTLFSDITTMKMYATGGVGSSFNCETFIFPYHLPNETAYAETCAAIALAFFCSRLSGAQNRAVYHEVFEQAVYNGVLSGMSADGKGFFYVNPLETHAASFDYNSSLKTKLFHPLPECLEVFDCACYPPNLTRFIAQIGVFAYDEEGQAVARLSCACLLGAAAFR